MDNEKKPKFSDEEHAEALAKLAKLNEKSPDEYLTWVMDVWKACNPNATAGEIADTQMRALDSYVEQFA